MGDEADKIRWFPAQPESGERPRLETIEITPELTSMTWSNYEGVFSTEFPVPGRRYEIREDEDLYLIARAVQRLGCPMTVADILKANSATKPSQLQRVGALILIPHLPGATNLTNSPSTPGTNGTGN